MIKSDRWIRRMAAENRLIEPFEAGQVKEVDGRKVVSFGTSSYGYDIRCSNNSRSSPTSTRRRPATDAKNFVDFRGDVTSRRFVRARATVQYFRIRATCPTVCLANHLCALRHHRQRHAARAEWGP
jgi:dCTP deaminase